MSASFHRAVTAAVLLTSLTLTALGRAAEPDMDAFVREVLARSPSVRAEGLRRDASRREATAEGLLPDPVGSVMVDRVPEHTGGEMPMMAGPDTAGAMVGVTIPMFGITRQNCRAAALDLRSNSGREDIDAMPWRP